MPVVNGRSGLRLPFVLVATALLAGCAHQGRGLSRIATPTSSPLPPAATAPAPAPASVNQPPPLRSPVEPLVTAAIGGAPLLSGARLDQGSETALLLPRLPSEQALQRPSKEQIDAAIQSGTLADTLRLSLADNPDIGVAAAQLDGERHAVEVARAGFRPTVSVRAAHGAENYENDSGSYTGTPRSEFGVDLHQTLYDFGRTSYNVARRKALETSARYRHLHKVNEIARGVAGAYLRILEADEQIRVAEANVASHEEIHQMVEAQQKGGNASVADVKRVTARLEKARTGLIDLRSRRQNAFEEFAGVAGFKPGRLAPPPKLPLPLPPAGMGEEDFPDNPELMSVRADIDSLRMQAGVAKANLEPSIDLDVTGGQKENTAGPSGETATFKGMISFNYKLMDGDAALNTARQIYSRVEENKQHYRKKRRDFIQSLQNAIRTVRTNLEKARLLDSRLADSRKVAELDKAQFKDGNKTLFELLDGQMDLYSAESEAIANRYAIQQSTFDIYAQRGDLAARLLEQPH